MFNNVNLDKEGVQKLVESINSSLPEHKLAKDKLEAAFEKWWPDFEESLKKVEAAADEQPAEQFKLEENVEEILSLLRSISRRLATSMTRSYFSPRLRGTNPFTEAAAIASRTIAGGSGHVEPNQSSNRDNNDSEKPSPK